MKRFHLLRSKNNKAYSLKLESIVLPIYCHMTNDLGACGGGGWTLVMKMDGTKVFSYCCFPAEWGRGLSPLSGYLGLCGDGFHVWKWI